MPSYVTSDEISYQVFVSSENDGEASFANKRNEYSHFYLLTHNSYHVIAETDDPLYLKVNGGYGNRLDLPKDKKCLGPAYIEISTIDPIKGNFIYRTEKMEI